MSNILLVEDSPTILHVAERMLTESGHTVIKATDGDAALRLAAEQKPDLVVLDVILPRINGYQVCRRLKAATETAEIPVVMLTSKSRDSDRFWGLEQGADGYITKPFLKEDLIQAIERFVGKDAPV